MQRKEFTTIVTLIVGTMNKIKDTKFIKLQEVTNTIEELREQKLKELGIYV